MTDTNPLALPPPSLDLNTPAELLVHFKKHTVTNRRDADQEPNQIRLSASGGCTRKALFTRLDPSKAQEDYDSETVGRFALGDAVHAMERGYMIDAGIRLSQVEATVLLHVPAGPGFTESFDDPVDYPGFTVPGHIDGVVELGPSGATEKWLLDIKTMNQNSWDRFIREGINQEYRAQLNSYLHALGLKRSILWCYNKNTSERMILTHEYDPQLQQRTFAHFRSAKFWKEGDPLPPPSYQPYDQRKGGKANGISVLYFKCCYCPFRTDCYPQYIADPTSPKPKFIYDTAANELADVIAGL